MQVIKKVKSSIWYPAFDFVKNDSDVALLPSWFNW